MSDEDRGVQVLELEDLEEVFHSDLEAVFEEKALEFSPHLRGMLLELWMRARERPADGAKQLERLQQLEKKKLEIREEVSSEFERQLPAVSAQFKSQLESATSSTFNSNLQMALELSDYTLDTALVKMLERVLELVPGIELTNLIDRLELRVLSSWSSTTIPELQSHDPDDEFQKALQKRLRREGVLPPETMPQAWNWQPVVMNIETGRQGILNGTQLQSVVSIDTFLYPDESGTLWSFPNPQPAYDSSDDDCKHVQLFTRGFPQDHDTCIWHHEWSADRGHDVVTEVTISGLTRADQVRAVYATFVKSP